MKNYSSILVIGLMLSSCGTNQETETTTIASDEEIEILNESTNIEEVNIIEEEEITQEIVEVGPSAAELAIGEWKADPDARAAAWEKEKNVTLSAVDKANMAKMFKEMYLNLNKDGSYKLNNPMPDLNGAGTWSINEKTNVLTLSKKGGTPMDFKITLQTNNKLQLKHEKIEKNHTSKINFEFKR